MKTVAKFVTNCTANALLFAGTLLFLGAHAGQAPTATEPIAHPLQDTVTASSETAMIDSLELIGVGVSVETYRNHPAYPKLNLWTAVERSNGAYIVSQELKDYVKDFASLRMVSAKRKEDAVTVAMRDFVDRYPLPVAVVGPALRGAVDEPARIDQRSANANSFVGTPDDSLYTSRGSYGMPTVL